MKDFEIRQLANGVMVMPTRSMERMPTWDPAQIYVFKTWAQASAWIRKQIEGGK